MSHTSNPNQSESSDDFPPPYQGMSLEEIVLQELEGEDFQELERYMAEHIQQEEGSSSRPTRTRKFINRGREAGHLRLMNDYFGDNPVYPDYQFRRRFRMRRDLFVHIVNTLQERYPYFQPRVDATGRCGLSPYQKCTAAIRMLAYGTAADEVDEYVRIGESTTLACTKHFVRAIREVFGPRYLRQPDANDVAHLLHLGERRGFPGMLGSIDCMHWEWKNCPVAWKGMYSRGDHRGPTIMLEAVASQDLWIWHAFFGAAGSNNDINVLNQSNLFTRTLQGQAPPVQFQVNGKQYAMGYYLADGIYPNWPTFVKTIRYPIGDEAKLFAEHQEGARKDVERAFGVLQARFALIRGPARMWNKATLADIMYACIILHNMIIEDERGNFEGDYEYDTSPEQTASPANNVNPGPLPDFATMLQTNESLHDQSQHHQLQQDLVDHIWRKFGGHFNG